MTNLSDYTYQPPDSLLLHVTNNKYGYEYYMKTITSQDNKRKARIIYTQGILRLCLYFNDGSIYRNDYVDGSLDIVEHKAIDYCSLGLIPL
jgi:hypothetical protein